MLYYFYPTVASLKGMSFNQKDAHKQEKLFLLYPHYIRVKNVLWLYTSYKVIIYWSNFFLIYFLNLFWNFLKWWQIIIDLSLGCFFHICFCSPSKYLLLDGSILTKTWPCLNSYIHIFQYFTQSHVFSVNVFILSFKCKPFFNFKIYPLY